MIRLVCLALLMAGPAAAQPAIPEAWRGAWFAGTCAEPSAALFATARSAVRIPDAGPARLFRFQRLGEAAGWLVGTAGGPEAPRLLLQASGGALLSVEPPAKLRDDALPGEAPPQAWGRCDTAPAGFAARHGEGLAFLAGLERLEAACGSGFARCAEALIAVGDVSGDGALSVAETARLIRGAAWLSAMQEEATGEAPALAEAAGALGGAVAARLLVDSLDFDGDARISGAELAQDRASLSAGLGAAEGRAVALGSPGAAAAVLRGLAELLAGPR